MHRRRGYMNPTRPHNSRTKSWSSASTPHGRSRREETWTRWSKSRSVGKSSTGGKTTLERCNASTRFEMYCLRWTRTKTNALQTISQWANPPLSVIDNRAATLTKLGNLPGALRDGRRMIQLGKTDATVGDPFSWWGFLQ